MAVVSIPSGSVTLFRSATAPNNWTKETADHDKMLRVTNGTVGTGGTVDFSTVLSSAISVPGTYTVSSISMSNEAPIPPAHTHTSGRASWGSTGGYPQTGYVAPAYSALYAPPSTTSTGASGGNGGHTHSISLASNILDVTSSINFAVKYVDMIVATRN